MADWSVSQEEAEGLVLPIPPAPFPKGKPSNLVFVVRMTKGNLQPGKAQGISTTNTLYPLDIVGYVFFTPDRATEVEDDGLTAHLKVRGVTQEEAATITRIIQAPEATR